MNKGITKWTNRSDKLNDYWIAPDSLPEYRTRMIEEIILELDKDKSFTVMDCGCGTGLLFKYLPDKYKNRYYGVDFTQDMIDFCKKEYPEYADRFKQLDLTDIKCEDMEFFNGHNVYATQNVIQHILLFQEALDNIFYACNGTIIMCERTHFLTTCIVYYEPVLRWRFNVQDFYDILTHFAKQYDYQSEVEIIEQPLSHHNREKAVTMFRVRRNDNWKVTHDELEHYITDFFIREKTVIRKWLPRKTKRERIKEYIKNKVSSYYTTIKNWVKAQVFEPVPSPSP